MSKETALADLNKLTPQEADLLNSDPDLLSRFKAKHGLDAPAAPAAPPSPLTMPQKVMGAVKQGYQMATPMGAAKTALRMIDRGENAIADKTTELATKAGAGPKLAASAGLAAFLLPDAAMAMATSGESKIPALEEASRGMAQRALGFSKRFLVSPNSRRKAAMAAETALENKVIPLSGNPETMMSRAGSLANNAGKMIGNIREAAGPQKIDSIVEGLESLKESKLMGAEGGNWDKIAGRINSAIRTIKGTVARGTIPAQAETKALTGLVDAGGKEIRKVIPAVEGKVPDVSLNRIETAKKDIADTVNWLVDNPGKQQLVKQIVGTIEGSVEDILRASGADMKLYQGAKKLYGAAKAMQMALNNELAGQAGNQLLKMKPMLAGAAELAAGNPLKAGATLMAGNMVQNRGAGTAAVMLRDASRARLTAVPTAAKGLVLTEAKAKEYLKKAFGNIPKARQLAAAAGWTIPE